MVLSIAKHLCRRHSLRWTWFARNSAHPFLIGKTQVFKPHGYRHGRVDCKRTVSTGRRSHGDDKTMTKHNDPKNLPYFSAIEDFWSHYSRLFLMCLIRDFIKLRVFDVLPLANDHDQSNSNTDEWISIDDVCKQLQMNAENTFRGLRYLSLFGYTVQSPQNDNIFQASKKLFRNSAKSQLLRSDNEYNEVSNMYKFYMHKDNISFHFDYIPTLMENKNKNDKPVSAWDNFHKIPYYDYMKQGENSDLCFEFYKMLTAFTAGQTQTLPKVYDFSGVNNSDDNCGRGTDDDDGTGNEMIIADIGGGFGDELVSILKHLMENNNDSNINNNNNINNSRIKTILFDVESVINQAKDKLNKSNFNHLNKMSFATGDFFSEISCEADIYILRYILHNWSDDECIKILKNIHKIGKQRQKVTNKSVKVLVIERIVVNDVNAKFDVTFGLDMRMMLVLHGRERTLQQYDYLFEQAGFQRKINPIPLLDMHIIEGSLVQV